MTSLARPVFLPQEPLKKSGLQSTNFGELVEGFLQGVKFSEYTTLSDECLDGSAPFRNEMQEAFNKFDEAGFYVGTAEVTKVLKGLTPVLHNCDSSVGDVADINKKVQAPRKPCMYFRYLNTRGSLKLPL